MSDDRFKARREAHEVALRDVRWFSTKELADRWGVSVQTVRAIPPDVLPYKAFGAGVKRQYRRYRREWVEDWLVPSFSNPTEPMSRRMMDYHLRRIVENAELVAGRVDPNGITFHTLRHTFVSWLLMKGADVFTAAQLAGNSVQQIEETYGHLSHDHRTTAINRLSGAVAMPGVPQNNATGIDATNPQTGGA